MKLKHLLIPYVLIIVILPAILTHLGSPFGVPNGIWQWILDGIMLLTALVGMTVILIRRRGKIRGWIPLLILFLLFLVPQAYLWQTMNKNLGSLRSIWRFSLLFITLFVIPLDVHFSRKEICIIIGLFVIYGFLCCAYEIFQHPRFLEYMISVISGSRGNVESFFGQKNRFGAYLALWIILCIFALQLSGKKIWIAPAVFFAVFLVMTRSRGGMLLTVLYCLCCLLSYHRRFGWKNIGMIMLDFLIVGCILMLIPPVRSFILKWAGVERGVSGRDRIWQISYEYFLESNPFLGHGIGVEIERILIERLGSSVSTHNVYLYILNSGGICLVLFYILSYSFLLSRHANRRHYLIPLLIAVMVYGFFELACAPFDFWHLSNMFTVCLFFIPAVSGMHRHTEGLQVHWSPADEIPE